MTFSCSRCGYTSKLKHHVCAHIQRKKVCNSLISDCAPELIYSTVDPVNKAEESVDKQNELSIRYVGIIH